MLNLKCNRTVLKILKTYLQKKSIPDIKINVIFRDAAGNSEKQIQDIETLMEYGIDILIVSPDGSDSLSSVLSEAFQEDTGHSDRCWCRDRGLYMFYQIR